MMKRILMLAVILGIVTATAATTLAIDRPILPLAQSYGSVR